jgi:tetratricopeptide (TPR) repeat protein
VFLPTERNRLLERGSMLQEEGHQESAEQLYREAVRRDPDDAQARVAAAVGLFDEDDLAATFSQLGPLSSRFPRSQAVHYYLAYLLAWTHQGADAIAQYRTTLRLGPTTELGRAAAEWLSAIAKAGAPAHAAA